MAGTVAQTYLHGGIMEKIRFITFNQERNGIVVAAFFLEADTKKVLPIVDGQTVIFDNHVGFADNGEWKWETFMESSHTAIVNEGWLLFPNKASFPIRLMKPGQGGWLMPPGDDIKVGLNDLEHCG
ncbi:hypothetical protein A3C86_03425 [Candidatus Kaiserbacteria bacterium RIFCSPHIGHO2_02_FULL_49_16]|uniref:Uncharacterized protein n=2 Tax=Candidatus Kaiseribacteriota TaxID=1752734 RepID=A0A1F6DHM5_9BACT|nr:MAG: hypothetical protein A3C86_03425 [Candidatus Kaiserbacteria bacterium RIFCSPHIGHO2_02_FULL_49_16]